MVLQHDFHLFFFFFSKLILQFPFLHVDIFHVIRFASIIYSPLSRESCHLEAVQNCLDGRLSTDNEANVGQCKKSPIDWEIGSSHWDDVVSWIIGHINILSEQRWLNGGKSSWFLANWWSYVKGNFMPSQLWCWECSNISWLDNQVFLSWKIGISMRLSSINK